MSPESCFDFPIAKMKRNGGLVGIAFKFGRMSSLKEGEHVLHTIDSVGFMTTLLPPSYHITVSLPPFVRVSISLTTRRFFLARIFHQVSS